MTDSDRYRAAKAALYRIDERMVRLAHAVREAGLELEALRLEADRVLCALEDSEDEDGLAPQEYEPLKEAIA